MAFMDIGPVVKGHTLVIPKQHLDPITGAPPVVLHRLIEIVQKITMAQYRELKADGVNVSQANGQAASQIVPHVHFHVIPRFLAVGPHRNWSPRQYDSIPEMQSFADRIRAAL